MRGQLVIWPLHARSRAGITADMQSDTDKQSIRRRPERLFVSLNAREKAAIEEAAAGAQLNMTEWARTVLLASAKREVKKLRPKKWNVPVDRPLVSQFEQNNITADLAPLNLDVPKI